jgi:hypothetical protein
MALPPEIPRDGQENEQPRSDARRRLLQGGLAAGSVLMTVASRPVLGQTACLSASAAMSMPASGSRTTQVCSGLTPEQWEAMGTQWPTPYIGAVAGGTVVKSMVDVSASTTDLKLAQTTTQRRTPGSTSTTTQDPTTTTDSGALPGSQPTLYHCLTTGFGGRVFGNRSMMNVLGMTGHGSNLFTLGRYMVAALLNARSGRTPVLDEAGVRNMWNDLVNRGYYEPTAGVRWSAPEIVSYIRTTMG